MKKFIALITKEKKAKNEWENDDYDFLAALQSIYKKLGQFIFHILLANFFKQRQISSARS